MKSVQCNAFGPLADLVVAEVAEPVPTGRQVVIKVEAAGVNYPDGLLVQGLYQMRPELPFTPGMEAAGEVVALGPDVSNVKVGDRVGAVLQLGGYAEQAVVDERATFPIGDADAAETCALLVAYGTSHHALKQRAALQAGETLVVLGGAGATGLAAIQIGKIMGATVIAVCSSAEKQQIARDAGADHVIGYDALKEDIKRLTDGKGADVVFDVVGGAAFDACCRAMARNGRLLIIGFASGEIPKFPVNLALVKEFALVGVFWGNFTRAEPAVYADNMQELMGWYRSGQIKPLIEGRYPLAEAAQVLERILNRGAVGKLVLAP
ncbi:Alcohol dehydrogenase [Thalassovita autumnalis]|uniref:Alcohol dehydrogenase n=1 Tax=Thalassovita autumnalis TaxID=2072972 RepID=A0A0P1FGN7_9RHOB|nr:NADPH:quinone oxidoreductase family protein [Thalassovita autumnalis]CUH67132.1 Alcohol dehydrogenase [Thalassovita autumnalis]CUH71046.1 Alcohol dehydrogenase [Thalassovita autumnalis]